MKNRYRIIAAVAVVAATLAWALPASAQWVIESKDQKTNIKIGFLSQGQFESITTPDGTATATNLFLRRFRILFGGKVSDKWTYFFETDNPNLGKGTGTPGTKDTGTMYIQDAFVTYNHSDEFKIDAGMLLLAQSRNHEQSAGTLLPVDYGAYTFLESTPMAERVGRDYGIEIRGYPAKQHFEYRLGVFQGIRGIDSRNSMRIVGRGVWYPFAAESGYFYGGTFQGQKRQVGIGASFDKQRDYGMYGVDFFVEQPINKGEQGVTFQVDWNRINGGNFIVLPLQYQFLVEGGVHFNKGKASVFGQYAKHTYDNPATAQQYAFQVGAAYWLAGHNRNIKVSIGRQHTDRAPDRTQLLAQLQIFYY
ncbi:MAG: hypothetical protein WCP29_08545 [Acidobacteriota bacterium]